MDFVSGELSGTEGDPIDACVVITRGGNQLAEDVNVVISPSDVTTFGKLFNCSKCYHNTKLRHLKCS